MLFFRTFPERAVSVFALTALSVLLTGYSFEPRRAEPLDDATHTPSNAVSIQLSVDASAFAEFLPLTVAVGVGRTHGSSAWETYEPSKLRHRARPPEHTSLLDIPVDSFEVDLPETETVTVFVFSKEAGFHFRKTYALEGDAVDVALVRSDMTTLRGRVTGTTDGDEERTRLALGVTTLPFDDSFTIGYAKDDGSFDLRVTKGSESTLVANKANRHGWVGVDTSVDKDDIQVPLRESVEIGVIHFDSPEFNTLNALLDYGRISMALDNPAPQIVSLYGVPLGTPELRAFEFDPDLDRKLPTTERGVIQELRIYQQDMGRITIPLVPETRKVMIRFTLPPDAVSEGMVNISGRLSSGEYFSTTDEFFWTETELTIPDSDSFRISAVLPVGGAKIRRYHTVIGTVDPDEAVEIDFRARDGVTVLGSMTGRTDFGYSYVHIFEGIVDHREMAESPKRFSLQIMFGNPANDDGTFSLEGIAPGEYTLVGQAFHTDGDESISGHFFGSARVSVGTEAVEAEIPMEEIL